MRNVLRLFIFYSIFLTFSHVLAFSYQSTEVYDYTQTTYEDMKQSMLKHDPVNRSIIFMVIGFDNGNAITTAVLDIVPTDASCIYNALGKIYVLKDLTEIININFCDVLYYFANIKDSSERLDKMSDYIQQISSKLYLK